MSVQPPTGTRGSLTVTVLDGDVEREHRTPRGTLAFFFSDAAHPGDEPTCEGVTDPIATSKGWAHPDAKERIFEAGQSVDLAFAEDAYRYACDWLSRQKNEPLIWSELVELWGHQYAPPEDAIPVGGRTWYGAEKRHSVAVLKSGESVIVVYAPTCGGRVRHIEWSEPPEDDALIAQVSALLAPGRPSALLTVKVADEVRDVFESMQPPSFDLDLDELPPLPYECYDPPEVRTIREVAFSQRPASEPSYPSPEIMETLWAGDADEDRVLYELHRANRPLLQRGLTVYLNGDPQKVAADLIAAGWECQVLQSDNAVVIRYRVAEVK